MNLRKLICIVLCALMCIGCTAASASEIPQNYLIRGNVELFGNGNPAYFDRSIFQTITFLDTLADAPADAWDASEDETGSVKAWIVDGVHLYIAGEGGVASRDCERLFQGFSNVTAINFNNCFYTAGCTRFHNMFDGCYALTDLDLTGLDVSAANTMQAMFLDCRSLTTLDLSGFNTENATNISAMFSGCTALTELDLSSFSTSNVTDFWDMFRSCESLKSLNVSSFDTSSGLDFSCMFINCKSLEKLDLSNFDMSSCKTASMMFKGCEKLADIGCELVIPESAAQNMVFAGTPLE